MTAANPDWIVRFERLHKSHRIEGHVLQLQEGGTTDLPAWLSELDQFALWQRNNTWMLAFARQDGTEPVTLIALWDGKTGDCPDGTQDIVEICKVHNVETRSISTDLLCQQKEKWSLPF